MEEHMASDSGAGRISRRRLLGRILSSTGAAILYPGHRAMCSGPSSEKAGARASAAEAFAVAAVAFVKALSAEQHDASVFSFTDERREDWHYIPKPRKGVPYKQLDATQRRLADALLEAGLSSRGIQ